MKAAAMRRELEMDERMSLAWHIEAFARTKKLPKLKDIIGKASRKPAKPKAPQGPDEQFVNMKAIFLAFGGDPEVLKTLQ